jgi:hypothetical protein
VQLRAHSSTSSLSISNWHASEAKSSETAHSSNIYLWLPHCFPSKLTLKVAAVFVWTLTLAKRRETWHFVTFGTVSQLPPVGTLEAHSFILFFRGRDRQFGGWCWKYIWLRRVRIAHWRRSAGYWNRTSIPNNHRGRNHKFKLQEHVSVGSTIGGLRRLFGPRFHLRSEVVDASQKKWTRPCICNH